MAIRKSVLLPLMKKPFLPRTAVDMCSIIIACTLMMGLSTRVLGQAPGMLGTSIRYGEQVPAEVEQVYERGLQFLAQSQRKDGDWSTDQQGSGITGLCVMAFLAHGEDPNFGRYSQNIRRAVKRIVERQNKKTGYVGGSMYHHGFAMLALSEAYGAVDESLLWVGENPEDHSIGGALELAVRCAMTAQRENGVGGWRYSPMAKDADTSVSGAVLMGLLAARNAGIEVPDKTVDNALNYFKARTHSSGSVDYTSSMGGFSDSMNRSAIATLVYAIGKRKGWKEFDSTLSFVSGRIDHKASSHPSYFRYYMAQALFQGDFDAWKNWKSKNNELIRSMQRPDGSITATYGETYGTAMALLSLALEYRFLPIYER